MYFPKPQGNVELIARADYSDTAGFLDDLKAGAGRAGSFLKEQFEGGGIQTSRQMPTATHTGSSFLLPIAVLGIGVAAVLILKKKKKS